MAHVKNNYPYKGAILLILLLAIAVGWSIAFKQSSPPQELMGVLRIEPKPLQSFELIDQKGKPVNQKILNGKWSFVFFGYTSCPDVCPVALQVLNTVIAGFAKTDEDFLQDTQVVFVSVDPGRDTAAKLAAYMEFFNKDFIGVTGEKKNIDVLTRQFGAAYMMEQAEASVPEQYLVSHTSAIFLVDPDANLVASFSQPHNPETITAQYQKVRTYLSK